MKKIYLIPLFLFLIAACSHEPLVSGEGSPVQDLLYFDESLDEIFVSGGFDIELDDDVPEGMMMVTTYPNIKQYISLEEEDDALHLQMVDGFRYEIPDIKVRISPADFHVFSARGTSKIRAEEDISVYTLKIEAFEDARISFFEVHAKNVDMVASGNAEIYVEGQAIDVLIEASGHSRIDSSKLLCLEADVTTAGNAFVSVFASGDLDIVCSGESEIHYYGNPISCDIQASGSSVIKKC